MCDTACPTPLLTLSSPLLCILAPIHMPWPPPTCLMCLRWSCDCIHVMFVCHWVAHTGRDGLGDLRYTIWTWYQNFRALWGPGWVANAWNLAGGDSLHSHPSLWAPRDFMYLLIYLLSKTYWKIRGPRALSELWEWNLPCNALQNEYWTKSLGFLMVF